MRALRIPARVLVAGLCLLVAWTFATGARDEDHLRAANRAGLHGDLTGAIRDARAVRSAPAAAAADALVGRIRLSRGDAAGAVTALGRAVARRSGDWSLHRDLAVALLARGDRPRARREMSTALALNPRLVLPPGFTR